MANHSPFDTIGDILNYAYWYGFTPAGATSSEIATGFDGGDNYGNPNCGHASLETLENGHKLYRVGANWQ